MGHWAAVAVCSHSKSSVSFNKPRECYASGGAGVTTFVRSAPRTILSQACSKSSIVTSVRLRGFHITYALEHLKTTNPPWNLRAKALLALAYCTMPRRAELVALRVEDLSFNAEVGDGVALIRNTKAGREQSRYLSREAVTWLSLTSPASCILAVGAIRRCPVTTRANSQPRNQVWRAC
jgi:integrase